MCKQCAENVQTICNEYGSVSLELCIVLEENYGGKKNGPSGPYRGQKKQKGALRASKVIFRDPQGPYSGPIRWLGHCIQIYFFPILSQLRLFWVLQHQGVNIIFVVSVAILAQAIPCPRGEASTPPKAAYGDPKSTRAPRKRARGFR